MKNISSHILKKINDPELVNTLARRLAATDLNTILLDVFHQRTAQLNAGALLRGYAQNRLVQPAAVDVIRLKEEELQTCRLLQKAGFEPVELSPVAQLGTSSVVAAVDQKKVLTALRGTEVQADPTNALALHYAHQRKTGALAKGIHRYCNISRVLRTQALPDPAYTPHFAVCTLTTMGRDAGSFTFEKTALLEHITAQNTICRQVYGKAQVRAELIPQKGYSATHPLIAACMEHLQAAEPGLAVTVRQQPINKNYYTGLQVKIIVALEEREFEIGDGGLVTWTQQLLSDKKERMFISGLGAQLLHIFTAPR
ncbi:hypothetical protein [Chitinophaga alhagiae]|uniref:hypothetical protein n=1 Tax=Chitinophaga alhagiae TaxID=2203219 RepID=UPI000E5A2F87|nr:hypothetical protein [Chitinophaga alhagiae]